MDYTSGLRQRIPALKYRARALAAVRDFFDTDGFSEIETPVGVFAPAAEEYIDCPKAGNDFFLRSSPELQMKRLLCAGMERIYQLGPCFRAGENGRLHRQEFTMLEWYHAHSDYQQLLDFTRSLVRHCAHRVNAGSGIIHFRDMEIDLDSEWEIISVRDAFRTFANKDADLLAEGEGDFEIVLTESVEPKLPKNKPCVLIDYPIRFGAFARPKASDPTLAERWEIYVGGVELANAYGELTDAAIQAERFRQFAATRKQYQLQAYPEPEAFLDAIGQGMPDSAGCALGFDRLVMLLYGASTLAEVSYPLDS